VGGFKGSWASLIGTGFYVFPLEQTHKRSLVSSAR
jgi:hypothetical protein